MFFFVFGLFGLLLVGIYFLSGGRGDRLHGGGSVTRDSDYSWGQARANGLVHSTLLSSKQKGGRSLLRRKIASENKSTRPVDLACEHYK